MLQVSTSNSILYKASRGQINTVFYAQWCTQTGHEFRPVIL